MELRLSPKTFMTFYDKYIKKRRNLWATNTDMSMARRFTNDKIIIYKSLNCFHKKPVAYHKCLCKSHLNCEAFTLKYWLYAIDIQL